MTDNLSIRADAFRLGTQPADEEVDQANRLIDDLTRRNAELEAENLRLRKCLAHTREEICEGPVDDVLWHTAMPSCTTVDNITLTLNDGWTYDGWLQAKEEQTGGQDR